MDPIPFSGPSPLEIVFSFDTTGSMSKILDEVKGRLQDMIQRLQADIPGIRIGIIAHGDYCDAEVFYLIKKLDLTNDIKELCEFVQNVEGTGGGDEDECYEYVLHVARTEISWLAQTITGREDHVNRILVLIGDAGPHEPDYPMNTMNLDWRQEYEFLRQNYIKIYGVQALDNPGVDAFYKEISTGTGGNYLKLENFSNICDFLMAICYREGRGEYLMGYEAEVRSRHGAMLHKDLEGMFGTLRRDGSTASSASIPVDSSVITALTRNDSVSSTRTMSISQITSSFSLPPPRSPIHSPVRKTDSTNVPRTKSPGSIQRKNIRNLSNNKQSNKRVKTITGIRKSKEKTTRKILRERASNSSVNLGGCDWSGWRELYTSKEPSRRSWATTWCGVLPSEGQEYWRRKTMFPNISRKTGLYEISVQTKPRRKRRVVYSGVIDGPRHAKMKSHNWEKLLFSCGVKGRQSLYERQIQKLLSRGCKVFVRRALFSKRQLHKLNRLQQYDYAWHIDSNDNFRDISMDGIAISDLRTPLL